jgi:phosphoglycerol transferase
MTSCPADANPDVTIVVPVYRNAATLPPLAARVRDAMDSAGLTFRLLLVVDASPDESWSTVRQLASADTRIAGLLLVDNVGQHAAVLAGLASADSPWFVVMDADLQDAPEAIPDLVARAREHGVSVFAARRGRYERWDRLVTSRLFKTVLRWVSGVPADVGTFFVVNREVADAMRTVAVRSPQVVVLAHHCSRECHRIAVNRATRAAGRSTYSSLARVRAAARSITCVVDCRRASRGAPWRQWSAPPRIQTGQRMTFGERWQTRRAAVYAALIAGVLCLAGPAAVFGPMHEWARYPLAYTQGGDALANLWVIKTVVETGSPYESHALGAPFGATFFDFPRSEILFLLFYRAAGLVTANIALIHNVFYLAGFPLVAWSALAVLRRELRAAWPLAVAGAIVFCWLPYHFLRLEHLHLSNYVAVPIAAWLMLRVGGERPPFFERGRLGAAPPAVWLAVALVALTSIYYAFFAVVLIAGVGAIHAVATRSWRPALSALIVVACIGTGVAIALTPAIRNRAAEGANPSVAARSVGESGTYALRPIHLLLPSASHTSAALASFARTYNASEPINENQVAALGFIGAAGFVLLLLHVFTGNRVLPPPPALVTLARGNLMAVLVGVSGGGGAVVALLVTPQFRALNRISVFVAFFSIAAVVAAIDRGVGHLGKWRAPVTYGVAAALVLFGFVDQRPDGRFGVSALAATFDSDRAFVGRIERLLPPDAMVYQLPYTQFPEVPPLHREPLYSPMRMFVHSRDLRWSYGGMQGRPGDYWHLALNRLSLPDRLAKIRAAGFAGIVLDRAALADAGLVHDQALAALGIVDRIESGDGTLVFYRLPDAATTVHASGPPFWMTGPGFYPEEGERPARWNWSSGNADMYIHHPDAASLPVELICVVRSLTPRQVLVRASDGSRRNVIVAGAGATAAVGLRFTLHPGWNTVRFETDGPAAPAAGTRDTRPLAFMVAELQLREDGHGQEPGSR